MKRLAWVVLAALVAVLCWLPETACACDPPWGGIHGITDGSTVSGTVKIEVTVKSETEVKGVDLYVDDKLVNTLAEAPYTYELDTTTLADGAHTIYAKVRALDRADGVSETLSFTVKNQNDAAGGASGTTSPG